MPDVSRNRRVDVLDGDAATVCRVVKRDVVFKRVGARHVVIVGVLPAPHHPARLVLSAAQRLEFHLDEAVREGNVLFDAPWERAAPSLLQNVFPAGRRRVGADGPLRIAGTCYTPLPTLRDCPGGAASEVLAPGSPRRSGAAGQTC